MRAGSLRQAGVDLPVALLALGFFLALVFQSVQLVREGSVLAGLDRSQDVPLQDTLRMRQSVDALASDVAALAQSGDANAKQIVDDMARQNVILRVNPETPAPPPPK